MVTDIVAPVAKEGDVDVSSLALGADVVALATGASFSFSFSFSFSLVATGTTALTGVESTAVFGALAGGGDGAASAAGTVSGVNDIFTPLTKPVNPSTLLLVCSKSRELLFINARTGKSYGLLPNGCSICSAAASIPKSASERIVVTWHDAPHANLVHENHR
jgi:hypothetical protein